MGLTPKMIQILKDEVIPTLKNDYGIKNNSQFKNSNIDTISLLSSVMYEDLPEEYIDEYDAEDIEELGDDVEQAIHNWACDYLMDEEWN